MEPRRLMAAVPIHVGVVYIEQDGGADVHGDTFEIQFEGGAPGTQLTRLVIDTDQNTPGYSVGDLIFDTVKGGPGADEAFPFTIVSQNGIGSVTARVDDGGQQLELNFTGFDAGEKLILSIDVDEIQQFEGNISDMHAFNEGVDPIASGVEFQGSKLTAGFTAPNYFDIQGNREFRNVYDPLFAGTNLLSSDANPNGLSPDNKDGKRDRTTGVMLALNQTPRPVDLCGAVYVDLNQNGRLDAGESGIGGVTIRVVPVTTIEPQATVTLVTSQDGTFCATGLMPGTYRVVEDQPTGLFDGEDRAGTVGGVQRGQAVNPGDRIENITLSGGEKGEDYWFGEYPPTSLRGRVRLTNAQGDCDGPGSQPLPGVTIELRNARGEVIATAVTNSDGEYEFTGLPPGTYTLHEITPDDVLDGDEHVGSAGGSISGDDTVGGIRLMPGQNGTDYDFCEHPPALLAGFVYHDANNDGVYEHSESPIAGVVVELRDAQGQLVGTKITDSDGFYLFDRLPAGVYQLVERQPDHWLDGLDRAGTVDNTTTGVPRNPGDAIDQIALGWGQWGLDYDFGELLPASLSGVVHSNPNEDCSDDSQATPLAGVIVELLDAAGHVVATTTTDAEGRYRFTGLSPGTYSVRETQPDDYFDNAQRAGTAGGDASGVNRITQIALGSGVNATDYEFCELPPSQLGGRVFQDGDQILTPDGKPPADVSTVRNGKWSPDDRPLAGVLLELRDGITGEPITAADALPGAYPPGPIRVRTDANGNYEFHGLRGHRSYAVYEVQPDGYFDGIDTPGTTSGVAFNPGEIVPQFVLDALLADPAGDAIVRIPLRYGEASRQNDFSEILVAAKPPEPKPPPPIFQPPPPAVPPPPLIPPSPPLVIVPATLPLLVRPLPIAEGEWFGGGGRVAATWHLSVLDAGHPRGNSGRPVNSAHVLAKAPLLARSSWHNKGLRETPWFVSIGLPNGGEESFQQFLFGVRGAIPVAGDFNGDGRTDLGIYYHGEWFIDINGNGLWDDEDLWAQLGTKDDQPVVGDWNGDGKADIGIFGPEWSGDGRALAREPGLPDFANQPKFVPKNVPPREAEATDGRRVLQLTEQGVPRADLIDHVFRYGTQTDIPISGDWDGDGIDTIGVFKDGRWQLDLNGDGTIDANEQAFEFGKPGDLPVVGDFDGDGIDEIGVYRGGVWYVDTNHNHQLDASDRVFRLGGPHDTPVVGDWNADGIDEPGIYGGHGASE